MLVGSLRLHLSNRLNFSLQDEKALMFKIDPSPFEHSSDLGKGRLPVIDVVIAAIVLERASRDSQLRIRHHFVSTTRQILDLLELDFYFAIAEILEACRVVDQSR